MSTAHDQAAILAIGDELVLGQKLDTNSQWLSDQLTSLGIHIVQHITVDDDQVAITAAMRRLAECAPLLIATGGLGPTPDDLTRPSLAAFLGEELIEDTDARAELEHRFNERGRVIVPSQLLQTQRPPSASMLDNPVGTAPGLTAKTNSCTIFCLPGPPREMQPMFVNHVRPRLRPPTDRTIRTSVLHTIALPEAEAGQLLGDLMNRDRNPTVGTTASGGMVSIRIRYEGDAQQADTAMRETEQALRAALDPFVFGSGEDSIESVLLDNLRQRNEMLLTAESCTGGLLGSYITEITGSSSAYLGGWVTYANETKQHELGVSPDLIEAHGAVSQQVAIAMAQGALATNIGSRAHHALALTGIAGPDGGSKDKPVGTVFIARAARDGEPEIRRFCITGDRHDIKSRSAKIALAMLWFHLAGRDAPKLLWQTDL